MTHTKATKTSATASNSKTTSPSTGISATPPAYEMESIDQVLVRKAPVRQNRTGLPDAVKSGVESLSGLALDDVRVHTNSSKPAQLQALAYTQGTDIHVGPGQERHIPHEAWHVVQQKQGRVKPTMQLKGRTPVNDDKGLEQEADIMGAKASRSAETSASAHINGCGCDGCSGRSAIRSVGGTVQRKITLDGAGDVDAILKAVLKHDNNIPGTINELKVALQDMIGDETDRTTPKKTAEDLQAKMVATYGEAKNVANVALREQFPTQAFTNESSGDDLQNVAINDILGGNVDKEIGYLVNPDTNKVVGAGLGDKREVGTHDIAADGKEDGKWAGNVMHHSHPSGSPPTLPNDIMTAVKRKASETVVHTRKFTFGLKMDYTKAEIKEYPDNIAKLFSVLATAQQGESWQRKAQSAKSKKYAQYVYDPNCQENSQEKEILAEEMQKIQGLAQKPQKWTFDLDYGMNKFIDYKRAETALESKGATVTHTTDESTYLNYRKGFYKLKDS